MTQYGIIVKTWNGFTNCKSDFIQRNSWAFQELPRSLLYIWKGKALVLSCGGKGLVSSSYLVYTYQFHAPLISSWIGATPNLNKLTLSFCISPVSFFSGYEGPNLTWIEQQNKTFNKIAKLAKQHCCELHCTSAACYHPSRNKFSLSQREKASSATKSWQKIFTPLICNATTLRIPLSVLWPSYLYKLDHSSSFTRPFLQYLHTKFGFLLLTSVSKMIGCL